MGERERERERDLLSKKRVCVNEESVDIEDIFLF